MGRVLSLTERVFEAALNEEKQRLERRLQWGGAINGSALGITLEGGSNSRSMPRPAGFSSRPGERERRRLAEIEAALERLDAGTYGRCEGCDSLIDVPTLLKTPWTRHCADCLEALAA